LKILKSFFYILFLLITSLNLYAKEKKAFTLDDLYKLKSISSLNISPDGTKLLFKVTKYCLKKGEQNSDIFLLNLLTGQQNQITYNKKSDFNPFWSSDGCKIYFISNREDNEQLWEIDLYGGESKKVLNFYTGISSPKISEKSKKIFFTSSVFPECMENCECNKKLSTKLKDGPIQAHFANSLLYRHWTSYRDWKYNHLFYFDIKEKKVKPITKGNCDYPSFSLGGGEGFDISPDGKEICIVSNHDKNQANSTNSDLFLINLESKGFNPINITKENKAYDGSPKFSANGKYIAFTTQKIPSYESDKIRLAIYNRKNKSIKILTEEIDNWVSDFIWSPDSKYIYFTVQENGHLPLYRININNKRKEKIIDAEYIREFVITPDSKRMIFTRSSVGEPYEIWSYRIGKKNSLKRLSFFNKKIEDNVDIRPAEELWVKGADNKKIHVFIVKPHNFDPSKKYPLILNVHGGPQMQWADSFRGDWQVYPGAGYVVAFPNPHGSTGYGQEFTKAISGDWNGKVIKDIEKVSDFLAALPYVDENRMGAMGWSWGGYAMMWLEGHNKRFKALASMMGVYDLRSMYSATEELWFPEWDLKGTPWENMEFYKNTSPSSYVKNFNTPCLIITGEKDYRVPYTQSLQFFTDLQKMKVPSQLIIFKYNGHWPNYVKSMPVYYNAHLEWFHKYLRGGKAPYNTEKLIRNLEFDKKECKKCKKK
jgi:dipeptidyl aminopeptidase/acylaminoacyl peptidase